MSKCSMCGGRGTTGITRAGNDHVIEVPAVRLIADGVLGSVCSDCVGQYVTVVAKAKILRPIRIAKFGFQT